MVDTNGLRERYVVLKASGSRFAYVQDTEERRTVARYDIFKRYNGYDGWTVAHMHAVKLENALLPVDGEGRA